MCNLTVAKDEPTRNPADGRVMSARGRSWRRVTKLEPCPICHKPDWCRIFDDGAVHCERVESSTPCRTTSGWMHWPNGRSDWRDTIPVAPAPKRERPTIGADVLDTAYDALLTACPPSAEHVQELRRRGHTDEQLRRHRYATLPIEREARRRVAAAVRAAIGRDPAGVVPGFVRKQDQTELVAMPGFIIPMRGVDRRFGAAQVRLDDPGDGGKYKHVSAGDGPHSVGADGTFVHVAYPDRDVSHEVVIKTESPLKANLIAARTGHITLGTAGVGNSAKLTETLTELGDVEEVWLANDQDGDENAHVAAADAREARQLRDAGYRVKRLTWPKEFGKGLDDALANGVIPVAIPHPALGADETSDLPNKDVGQRLEQLQAERDSVRWLNQTRVRIQRNRALPARGMAAAVMGAFNQAIAAEQPAGKYQGQVPAGFISAPIGGLSFDAGTQPNNGGRQLKALEVDVQAITRITKREVLNRGDVDPETGEILQAPRVTSHHFIAIRGHEHERLTPEAVRELAERLATHDPKKPEKRGGIRIPRCRKHPYAPVVREWVARCSACGDQLAEGADPVPPMLLEPISTVMQSLHDRIDAADKAPATDAQRLLARNASLPSTSDTKESSLGQPSNAKQVALTVAASPATDAQTLQDHDLPNDFGLVAPILSGAQETLEFASRATLDEAKQGLRDLGLELSRIAVERGRAPVPKPTPASAPESVAFGPDPWDDWPGMQA